MNQRNPRLGTKPGADVTERERVEELRGRLAAIVESSDDAIISKDLTGRINAWNRGAERVFGYSAAEALGKSMVMLFPPDLVDKESDILARISRGESIGHFETVRVRKDGTHIDVSVAISPIRDSDGVIVGASKIARDISERKRAQEALWQSDARRKFALETAKLGDWELDLATLQATRSLLHDQIFGYQTPLTEWNFDIFLRHVHPDDRERVRENFGSCLSQKKRWEFECRIVWPNGAIRWIWACGDHYRELAGDPTRMFGIVEDITERKQAEQTLRESEDRFLALANGIPQLAWMAEAGGHIFWYNQRWYDYTGKSFDQMEGWGWQSVHDPLVLPRVLKGWKRAIADGIPFEMEFPLRAADGRFGMFLTRVMPLKDATGHVVRWFGTNTDISERNQAEARQAVQAEELARSREALEAQTAMFKLVLDNMGEGLVAADQEGHFLLWNNAAQKLMGRGAADLPTEQWTPYYKVFLPDGITPYPPDQLPLVRALRGESVTVELIVQPPGTEMGRLMEVTARPLKDSLDNLRGGVAVLRDITERKRTQSALAEQAEELSRQTEELVRSQQALRVQTALLQSVLDSMGEGLVAADEHGKFILWNPAAEKIVGRGAANVSSQEWTDHYGLFLPDTVTPFPPDQNPLACAIRGVGCSAEMFVRNPELTEGAWIEANAHPLRGADGIQHGGVVAFRDITHKKKAEQEIHKLNEALERRVAERTAQLEEANQDLESFTYSVAHDLRAPLRHIAGFSGILVEEFSSSLDAQAQGYLRRIHEGTRKMGQLVDELLNLAKVGRQAPHLQPANLNSMVKEVISILQPEMEGRQIEWRIADLPFVECDPTLVKQVFQNLISNALKYSRPRLRAVIEIGHTQENRQSVFFVRDNGVGFNMKYADKLFGVFQRLHRSEDFEGTGVGLATVQRIVKKHLGKVWAEAELDKGATFYFTIGAARAAETNDQTAAVGA